jgi:ATP-dependent DNA helicase RecG
MDDQQLIKSAQLYQADPESGKHGVTLAGVMLFGNDNQILQVCPAHRTDLILRKVNVDRYDDRDLVRTNLIDSYDRILAFIVKHLSDPFYLEGIERRSLRDAIFREVASNMLIHREYASGETARLIIEYGKVTTTNANRPHGFGVLDPETSTPYSKNPVIGALFREIDRADELGSGMRNMMQYGKRYGGADPQLIEGDVFRMIISVPEFSEKSGGDGETARVTAQVTGQGAQSGAQVREASSRTPQAGTKQGPSRDQVDIIRKCRDESKIGDLMGILGRTNRTKFRDQVLNPLLQAGWLEMTSPAKPQSPTQKYRLTDNGRAILKELGS